MADLMSNTNPFAAVGWIAVGVGVRYLVIDITKRYNKRKKLRAQREARLREWEAYCKAKPLRRTDT